MAHGDWYLRYPGTALAFGSYESGLSLPDFPEVGTVSLDTDDTDRPRGDGVAFGQDFERENTVKFTVRAEGVDMDTGRALREKFAAGWRGDAVRLTPGAVATLESNTGRFAFGRPRRFWHDDVALRRNGIVSILADFQMVSALWYGAESSEQFPYVPNAEGGFTAPFITPITTSVSSDRTAVLRVGGTVATWPVITVRGPITNPSIEIGGVTFELWTTLAAGQSVVIDTRPWSRQVTRSGASVAGLLSPYSTRLGAASLSPGVHQVVLRGISVEGTANVEVRWRDAHATY